MKKIITITSIILLIISTTIVIILGQEKTTSYHLPILKSAKVKCNEKIVKCESIENNDDVIIKLKSVKPGKTKLYIETENIADNGELVKMKQSIKVYVHFTGVVTIGNYLGKCRGDISYIISFYIIILLILIERLMNYIKNTKNNLYSYKNVRRLGLITFISSQFIFGFSLFLYDYFHGYVTTLHAFIDSLTTNINIIIFLTFPLAFIITILVTISNIKLLLKEGKRLKNMLGIILGGGICLLTISNILIYIMASSTSLIGQYFVYLGFICITYLENILLATCILGFVSAKKIPSFDKDCIIILGCKIKEDGTLPPLLKGRVDKAIEFSKLQKENTNKDIIFIPSGGKGNDEVISEADAMKNYLLKKGINKKNIIVENKSKNTYENIKFSTKLIKEKIKDPKIAFSTTNYHVFRAGIIATEQNIIMEGIGSKTKIYYWINAFIREFVATLVSEKKSHIKTIIILMLILLINILIIFLLRII